MIMEMFGLEVYSPKAAKNRVRGVAILHLKLQRGCQKVKKIKRSDNPASPVMSRSNIVLDPFFKRRVLEERSSSCHDTMTF
jgi:hypothetical protein